MPIDGVPAAIEPAVDAVTTSIEPLGCRIVARGGGTVGGPIQAAIGTVTALVQPILDPITALVEAMFDSIAAAIRPRRRVCPNLRRAHEQPKT